VRKERKEDTIVYASPHLFKVPEKKEKKKRILFDTRYAIGEITSRYFPRSDAPILFFSAGAPNPWSESSDR